MQAGICNLEHNGHQNIEHNAMGTKYRLSIANHM